MEQRRKEELSRFDTEASVSWGGLMAIIAEEKEEEKPADAEEKEATGELRRPP